MLLVEAIWDHVAMLADELPFTAGDIITVVEPLHHDAHAHNGHWYGVCRDRAGWFPASYVRVKDPHDHYLLSRMVTTSEQQREEDSMEQGDMNTVDGENFPPAMRYLRKKIVEELV